MDNSRDHDLRMLHERFSDYNLHPILRRRARRSFERILSQQRDRTLIRMRHRLVGAQIAKDQNEIEKIGLQIREYNYRVHGITE